MIMPATSSPCKPLSKRLALPGLHMVRSAARLQNPQRQPRRAKVTAPSVRPLTLLRPAVRASTVRFKRRLREERGFTLAELKEAGTSKGVCGVGIVVVHNRRSLGGGQGSQRREAAR